jgi:hypothetical protein
MRLASSLLLLLAAACFVEQPEFAVTGDDDPGPTCAPGSAGCGCYGNGTCDAGLACAGPDVCVPMGCVPGHAMCVCGEAGCDAALVCVAGVCASPSTDEPGSSSSDGGDESGAGEVTSAGSSESGGSSEGSSEGGGSSSEGETPPVCDAQDCGACVDCVADGEGSCAPQAESCDQLAGCPAAAACLATCGVDGLCLDPCCEGLAPAAVAAALALDACREDACAATCSDYNHGQCS